MTDEDASPPPGDPQPETGADRDARLAALLSVDISPRSDPSADDVDAATVEVVADDAATADALGEVASTSSPAPDGTASDDEDGTAADEGPDTDELHASEPDAPQPDTAGGAEQAPAVAATAPTARPTWRRVLAGGLLVALVLTGTGLAYAGTRIVRSSTQGEVRTPVDDPQAPGFEALVDPTPTMVVMHDAGGLIDTLTVLTLPDPDGTGGGVLFVPTRTVADVPFYGESPLEIAYDLGDPASQSRAVGLLLGAAMQESAVVDAERWADLVEPVAPLEIDNPNELTVDGEVRFPAGPIELGPDDVAAYLEATVAGESDLARLFRHELFWDAWLGAVAADGDDDAVPGELRTGIARFVRSLAPGPIEIETLPVRPAAPGRFGDDPAFVPRVEQMDDLLARLIPFPSSPGEGERARVRVLNGTPDTSEASSIAGELPPTGVEVVIIGNAARLDVERTTIAYAGAEFRDEAESIAEVLGVGRVVEDTRPSDSVDITVTLGADHD